MTASELPSYVDQNFQLRDEGGQRFVLKIANSGEDPAILDAQVSALDLLQATPGHLSTPRAVRCSSGEATAAEGAHAVWLVTFLPGRTLAETAHQPAGLLSDLGRGLGDLDRRLSGFEHPAARRIHLWDLRNAPGAASFVDHITDTARRDAVRASLARFETRTLPAVDGLPFQVIHNDPNDYNLLVLGEGSEARVSGVLDFGDLVWTARACEAAIAMTYVMMPVEDPERVGALVLAGYHEACPLARSEIRVIPDLIRARLCVSVTMSSYRRSLDPGNEYLSVSEAPAWRLLERAFATPTSVWTDAFEDACSSVRPFVSDSAQQRAADEA